MSTANPFQEEVARLIVALCGSSSVPAAELATFVELAPKFDHGHYVFNIARLNKYRLFAKGASLPAIAAEWYASAATRALVPTPLISSLYLEANSTFFTFSVRPTAFYSFLFSSISTAGPLWGHSPQVGAERPVVIEFSSPNIAKPFHAGHLRSTVLGNFLVHGYRALGYRVHALNYLGDWGKQYGLLAVGFEKYGSEEALQKDPIRHLFEVYVQVNKDKKEDPEVDVRAKEIFREMEKGNAEYLKLWERFRSLSIVEYNKLYERLNIKFDFFDGESLQSEGMARSLADLERNGLITEDQGAKLLVLEKVSKGLGKVLVQKSDGGTLYITRDIAAAQARKAKYDFVKMIYVVAAQQDLHFKQLFKTLELLHFDWASACQHVNFGMVKGMSTRVGNVVFLSDILEEAKARMREKMSENADKLAEISDPDKTADVLGVTAVIVQDFSAKRIKDYDFDWDRMLAFKGDTGPYLQFAHARIASIVRKTADEIGAPNLTEFCPGGGREGDLALLVHKNGNVSDDSNGSAAVDAEGGVEMLRLAMMVARFAEKVRAAVLETEPNVLVEYLMKLSHEISSVLELVHVKGREEKLAKVRLAMYEAARRTLHEGMVILGLTPLDRM